MKAATESDVLRACLDLLRLRGIFAWRSNTAGVRRRDRAGREFWAHHGLKGCADILGILPKVCPACGNWRPGTLLAVETKRPGGKLTQAQKWFLDAVRQAGGLSLVVRDVRELDEALRREGVP